MLEVIWESPCLAGSLTLVFSQLILDCIWEVTLESGIQAPQGRQRAKGERELGAVK